MSVWRSGRGLGPRKAGHTVPHVEVRLVSAVDG
jgi:hypothetical protein